jgi:hypothetical protein
VEDSPLEDSHALAGLGGRFEKIFTLREILYLSENCSIAGARQLWSV